MRNLVWAVARLLAATILAGCASGTGAGREAQSLPLPPEALFSPADDASPQNGVRDFVDAYVAVTGGAGPYAAAAAVREEQATITRIARSIEGLMRHHGDALSLERIAEGVRTEVACLNLLRPTDAARIIADLVTLTANTAQRRDALERAERRLSGHAFPIATPEEMRSLCPDASGRARGRESVRTEDLRDDTGGLAADAAAAAAGEVPTGVCLKPRTSAYFFNGVRTGFHDALQQADAVGAALAGGVMSEDSLKGMELSLLYNASQPALGTGAIDIEETNRLMRTLHELERIEAWKRDAKAVFATARPTMDALRNWSFARFIEAQNFNWNASKTCFDRPISEARRDVGRCLRHPSFQADAIKARGRAGRPVMLIGYSEGSVFAELYKRMFNDDRTPVQAILIATPISETLLGPGSARIVHPDDKVSAVFDPDTGKQKPVGGVEFAWQSTFEKHKPHLLGNYLKDAGTLSMIRAAARDENEAFRRMRMSGAAKEDPALVRLTAAAGNRPLAIRYDASRLDATATRRPDRPMERAETDGEVEISCSTAVAVSRLADGVHQFRIDLPEDVPAQSRPGVRIGAPPDAACVSGVSGPWRRDCAPKGVSYEASFGSAGRRSALIDIDISEDQDGFTLAGPPRLSYGGSRKEARESPPKAPSSLKTPPRIIQIFYSKVPPKTGGQGDIFVPVEPAKGGPRAYLRSCANVACRWAPASADRRDEDDYDGALVNAAAASARQKDGRIRVYLGFPAEPTGAVEFGDWWFKAEGGEMFRQTYDWSEAASEHQRRLAGRLRQALERIAEFEPELN